MAQSVTLVLGGNFAVLDPDGNDLTPSSRKARALLVLLALAPRARRSRLWLQQMLWSSRSQAQAAGSLRQALVEIRRALGAHAGILTASRSAVVLDAGSLRIDNPLEQEGGAQRFLQGFGIVDPPFDAWLLDLRGRVGEAGTPASDRAPPLRAKPASIEPVGVRIAVIANGQTDDENLLLFMEEFIGRSLAELHDVAVLRAQTADAGASEGAAALTVTIRSMETSVGALSLRATIDASAGLQTYWSNVSTPIAREHFYHDITGCLAFSLGVVHAVSHVIATQPLIPSPDPRHAASVMSATAVRRMFSMRHSELAAARGLISDALAISPRGLHHARRAQLAILQLIERQSGDIDALGEQARADIALAMEKEPLNSNVLATAAHVQNVFERDHEASHWLARQSIAANHANPFGWWSLSNALLYLGRSEEAYDAAVRAHSLADQTWLKHWVCFQRSLTAAVSGRHAEAVSFGAAAHALAPHFRPPLRYLIALHAKLGDYGRSARAADLLAAVEPGFSVQRLVQDRDYPASFLHRAGLVEPSLDKRLDR